MQAHPCRAVGYAQGLGQLGAGETFPGVQGKQLHVFCIERCERPLEIEAEIDGIGKRGNADVTVIGDRRVHRLAIKLERDQAGNAIQPGQRIVRVLQGCESVPGPPERLRAQVFGIRGGDAAAEIRQNLRIVLPV